MVPLRKLPQPPSPSLLGLLLASGLAGCSHAAGLDRLDLQLTIRTMESVTRQEMARAEGRFTSIRPTDQDPNHCRGGGGFTAFSPDTAVDVYDQNEYLLGSSTLGMGTFKSKGRDIEGKTLYEGCDFRTKINLTNQARIYILRIGGETFVRRFHVSQLRNTDGLVKLKVD
jgi:hypothetical protein